MPKIIEPQQTMRVEVKIDGIVVEVFEKVILTTKDAVLFRNKVAREMLQYDLPKQYWFNKI